MSFGCFNMIHRKAENMKILDDEHHVLSNDNNMDIGPRLEAIATNVTRSYVGTSATLLVTSAVLTSNTKLLVLCLHPPTRP